MRAVLKISLVLLLATVSQAQQTFPRFEIGVQTAMAHLPTVKQTGTVVINGLEYVTICNFCRSAHWSLGPAMTLSLNRYLALDGTVSYFPVREADLGGKVDIYHGGHLTQGFAGVKATMYRSRRFTVFARTRPGVMSYSHVLTKAVLLAQPNNVPSNWRFNFDRRSYFAFDVGAGVQYTIAPQVALRFDVGDTLIRWSGGMPFYTHNLQTSSGVYYRWGRPLLADVPAHRESQILNRLEIGTQFTMLRIPSSSSDSRPLWSFGPGFTFNFNDHFALDGAFSFFPANRFPAPGSGGHLSEALAGLKGSLRASRFTLFAKARPGMVHWTNAVTQIELVNGDFHLISGGLTAFALDLGGGFEYSYVPGMAIRMEIGSTVVRSPAMNGADGYFRNHLQTSSGVYYRFGKPISWERPRPAEKPHRFFDRWNIPIMTAGLLAQTADSITTQRTRNNCLKAVQASSHPDGACANTEDNPLFRPFVRHGWAGQVPLMATVATGQTLLQYAVHRMGYHKVERLIPLAQIIGNSKGAYDNINHSP